MQNNLHIQWNYNITSLRVQGDRENIIQTLTANTHFTPSGDLIPAVNLYILQNRIPQESGSAYTI